jgi:hypothetical protein
MSELTSHDLVHLGEGAVAHMLDPGIGGGATRFREEQVKRDAHGKFASQNSLNARIDALWMDPDNLQGLEWQILNGKAEDVMRITKKIADKYGIDWREVETKHFDEAAKAVLDILNTEATKSAVAPSGTQRLHFYLKGKDLKSKAIPYSGPNPHPAVTSRLKKQAAASARNVRNAKTDDKPMFNPDYKLDTSQVQWRRKPSFRMSDLIGDNGENVLIHMVGFNKVRSMLGLDTGKEVTDGTRRID